MYLSDYHAHSSFSFDSKASMENMVLAAIAKNINEYCVTDHVDTFEPKARLQDIFPSEKYLDEYKRLQKLYKDKINLKLGIELGLEPTIKEEFVSFSKSLPFDFIIGSTHNINFRDLVSGGDFFNQYSQKDYYEMYLEHLLKAANMHQCFDIMGHIDYVVRYVPYKEKEIKYSVHSNSLDKILKMLIENGKGLEINTAGLRYGLPFCHPHMDILKRYKQLGGQILTIGSDAHKPQSIGEYHKEGISSALEAGFTHYTRFDQRKPIFEKLTDQ